VTHGGCLLSRRWSSMALRSTTQCHKVSKTAVGHNFWPSTTIAFGVVMLSSSAGIFPVL
jgi:hypothetical protein